MIRDFDESGGRPWRGPESFKRPALEDYRLVYFIYHKHEVCKQLDGIESHFSSGRIAVGLRRAKQVAAELERQPYYVQVGALAWLVWQLEEYASPVHGIRFARRALLACSPKGLHDPMTIAIYYFLAKMQRRIGDVAGVRESCLRLLTGWSESRLGVFAFAPGFLLGELLYLEGKYAEALPHAEQACRAIKKQESFERQFEHEVHLLPARIHEAMGDLAKAHAGYVAFIAVYGHRYVSRTLHELAWDGFHRTKPLARLKF
jgi:tetratricopeptide (TPR) repeat protein